MKPHYFEQDKRAVESEIKRELEGLCPGGTLHDDEEYIVINPNKWQEFWEKRGIG